MLTPGRQFLESTPTRKRRDIAGTVGQSGSEGKRDSGANPCLRSMRGDRIESHEVSLIGS